MSWTLDELQMWDDKIQKLVLQAGLNPYPQEFEICDYKEMLGYMAYSGMPSRYPHWSFGKQYERQKTMYDYGVSGLPYEMVINSNPCLAYLMKDNSLLLQVLTMAHVYGHNDFFANNSTFLSGLEAAESLKTFKGHANFIRNLSEDASASSREIERVIDAAHSLSLHRSTNLWIENSNKSLNYQNILQVIAEKSPNIQPWAKEVLKIIDTESRYFIPQIETKIMNEGWASYWHYQIINALDLPESMHLEFLVKHNQVIKPIPGQINPYHLGFNLFRHIERKENLAHGIQDDRLSFSERIDTPGRKLLFEIREVDRDTSFIRRFLDQDIVTELDMYQHEKRGQERVVTKTSDEKNFGSIKATLIAQVGLGSIPVLTVSDTDDQDGGLLIQHQHDGRDLSLEACEPTMKHLETLWGGKVTILTVLSEKRSKLELQDGKLISIQI